MPLRTDETKANYLSTQAKYKNFSQTKDYREDEEHILQSFTHWYLIANLFPYDKVAKQHDLLIPKRVFGKMSDCTKEEWEEYKQIINQFELDGHYNSMLENFSKGKSILRHLHIHLIVWKD